MPHTDWRFCDENGAAVDPRDWLATWSPRFPDKKFDELVHDDLMSRHDNLTALDFERMGRWKDAAITERRWRPNVASVAYPIWLQAAAELPRCPDDSDVAAFLDEWASRAYVDRFESGPRAKTFGLSRATTLLYFLSGGRYPIFDSRVRTAIRLLGVSIPKTVEGYLLRYRPLLDEIMKLCECDSMRAVDRALFSFGGKARPSKNNRSA